MRKIVLILLVCIIYSCNLGNKNGDCNKEFRENLRYLKQYSLNKDDTYAIKEVENKIEFLETQSGIETQDKGNIIGRFIVTEDDINNWEKWLKEKCDIKSD